MEVAEQASAKMKNPAFRVAARKRALEKALEPRGQKKKFRDPALGIAKKPDVERDTDGKIIVNDIPGEDIEIELGD